MGGEERVKQLLKHYGIPYGAWTPHKFNREQRRKYIKNHKKDKNATICSHCKNRTLKITNDYGKEVCELCGKRTKYEDVGVISNE